VLVDTLALYNHETLPPITGQIKCSSQDYIILHNVTSQNEVKPKELVCFGVDIINGNNNFLYIIPIRRET
jgi:hypothetical protein